MAWCRTALWIWILAAVYERSCSSSTNFSNSLSLTRSIRVRVKQLLIRYKEEQFSDKNFDDKRIILNTLPSVTISYRTWLQMEDTERLYRASRDLQSFWTHLDSQRQKLQLSAEQLGKRELKKRSRQGRRSQSLSQSILGIQLDLRDLMKQVKSQLLSMRTLKKTDEHMDTTSSSTSNSTVSPPSTRSALDPVLSSTQPRQVQHNVPKPASSQWLSVLEGYVILRDLERYLSRLVRDYTLLRSKF